MGLFDALGFGQPGMAKEFRRAAEQQMQFARALGGEDPALVNRLIAQEEPFLRRNLAEAIQQLRIAHSRQARRGARGGGLFGGETIDKILAREGIRGLSGIPDIARQHALQRLAQASGQLQGFAAPAAQMQLGQQQALQSTLGNVLGLATGFAGPTALEKAMTGFFMGQGRGAPSGFQLPGANIQSAFGLFPSARR